MKKQEKEKLQKLIEALEDINEVDEHVNQVLDSIEHERQGVEKLKKELGVE